MSTNSDSATPTVDPNLATLLASIVSKKLQGAEAGHCVRVNHLDRTLASSVLKEMEQQPAVPNLTVSILETSGSRSGEASITADRAIEIRNRKSGVFCLFVPASQHDSTASSLGNSFAEINGPHLIETAYKTFMREHATERVRDVVAAVNRVFTSVGPAARPADIDRLQFAIAAQARERQGERDSIGLELWRLGLVPDARTDYDRDLWRNRKTVGDISRPATLMATIEERVGKLGLTPSATVIVLRSLRGLNLHNPKSWCKDLADLPDGTFDHWIPVDNPEPSDCNKVHITPFRTEAGLLNPKVKGLDVDAPGGALFAGIGDKQKLRFGWATVPKNTTVSKWRLEIVPADERANLDDLTVELPSTEIRKGSQRTGTISLDLGLLEGDDLPNGPFQVKVSALSDSDETLVNGQDQMLTALSDEFYFRTAKETPEVPKGPRNQTASTLPEAMLRAVALYGAQANDIEGAAWTPGTPGLAFSMRATPREVIRISFNSLLWHLQDKTLEHPDALGLWRLHQDDVAAANLEGIVGTASPTTDTNEVGRYLRARKTFFNKVLEQKIRKRIEVVDWTEDLIDAALAHSRAWVKWLDTATGADLRVARSVDTLDVNIGTGNQPALTARIVLPTHPLRALWFANHASLFTDWMLRLEEIEVPKRKQSVELGALANVAPTNVPPLLHHIESNEPYVFYRNLDAGYGVAFPASTENPGEQFALLGTVLGYVGVDPISEGKQPKRAAKTTQRFRDAHPYADPFKLALINPDDGTFAGQMLQHWEDDLEASRQGDTSPDEHDPVQLPGLFITSYSRNNPANQPLRGLERRRRSEESRTTIKPSDHLRPSLSIVEAGIEHLSQSTSDHSFSNEHHLALIQDLSTPKPVGQNTTYLPNSGSGLGLYGLVARFSTLHQRQNDSVNYWLHWIDTSGSVTPHPVDKRLSDGMVEAHRAAGSASGRLLDSSLVTSESAFSAIGVYLKLNDLELLRKVHESSDWVLIVDRFFGTELFDTPQHKVLGSDHQTYILDASPDYQDGMGHRSLVTTSSRDEVEAILARAMGKFGFEKLNESVGSLIQTLKMVSGRLVLDALQTDTRAREVVALGAVVTWLQANSKLKDTIIVPVDSHLDLFRPGISDLNDDHKRCDLALFRFVQNRLTITLVEVKARTSLAGLDDLVDHMDSQMNATARVLDDRYFTDDLRIDGDLQRSLLAHVLRFYLDRAERYGLVHNIAALGLRKKINLLEVGSVQVDLQQQGFVLALGEASPQKKFTIGDRTEIRILTISEIAKAAHAAIPLAGPETTPIDVDLELPSNIVHEKAARDNVPAELESGLGKPDVSKLDSLKGEESDSNYEGETQDHADTLLPAQDVVLGDSNDSPVLWRPRTAGSPHLFILGIPGQGKTITTERILIELAKTQTPALVLDFHGTFAESNSEYARVANPVIIDAADGLPFSPFAINPRSNRMQVRNHAKEMSDVIDHVFGLGEIQADVMFTTIRDLYQRRGFGETEDGSPDPETPTFADVSKALDKRAKESGVKNVVARTRALFEFDLFNPPLAGAPGFVDLLRRGVVVRLNRLGGDELALALSAFLLRSIYLSMTSWPIADRIRLVIVLDEAHKLAKDITLPKLMKEGRKYGVAIVVASQGLADFHHDVVGNAGTKLSFRLNNPESRKVSQFFKARPNTDLVHVLESLQVGQALVQTPEMRFAQRAKMRRSEA